MEQPTVHDTHVQERQKTFTEKAADFDKNPILLELCDAASKVLKAELLQPSFVVMDFGCGTGLLSFAIAGSAAMVLGVDSSEGMVQVFQSKTAAVPSCNLRSVCVNLEGPGSLHAANDPANPYPESFDLVMSTMTFHHIEDIPGSHLLQSPAAAAGINPAAPALALLVSHLKPGGRIAVFDYRKNEQSHRFHPPEMDHTVFHKAGFSPEELCSYFTGAGLIDVSCRPVHAFKKPAGDDSTQQMNCELLMAVGTQRG